LNPDYILRTIRFADDQLLTANTKDELQNMAHKLQLVATNFNTKISTDKTKVMDFCGMDHIRAHTAIDNKSTEQVSKFKYLG
jgi:hypothetical protein